MPFTAIEYLRSIEPQELETVIKDTVTFGRHPETGDLLLVDQQSRYAGTYVIGVQGVGKSGLLENLIYRDCQAGNAIVIIDPHGDLITHVMQQIPEYRIPDTYLLDMEDEAYPFGVNVFHTGKLTTDMSRTQAVDRLMHIFEVLWTDVLAQAHLPRYVRAATIALLANPGATLVDMYDFLLNDQVRQRMLKHVQDSTVLQFWNTQFDNIKPEARLQRVQPLVARLESLFMGRSLVRNILGQRKTTINFRKAIENKEVILVRLPLKIAKQDAQLIGTILMAQIHAAIFSFGDVPDAQRPGFSLYIDEFQNFSTPDIAELFTEGRKYGVKLTIAHQYRNQLPGYLQDATMTAYTKVCFQTTPEDGREMAHLFPAQEELRPEDIEAHPSNYLLTYSSDDPYIEQFVETYLRPMSMYRRGHRIQIMDIGEGMRFMGSMLNLPDNDVFVPEPTPWLDSLLYQVMRSGDPMLPIPREIIRGFANCGYGFFPQVRTIGSGDAMLSSSVCFPPSLVAPLPNGSLRWLRSPESGKEQVYHLIFHLRMMMDYLADHPLGRKTQQSTSIVGQMLTQLPRRAAFVRSGTDVGVIYTEDTMQPVEPSVLQDRLAFVRNQTREKYCHPRTEVDSHFIESAEAAISNQATSAQSPVKPPTISRWEEA